MTQGSLGGVGTDIHDWHLAVNHCPGALRCRAEDDWPSQQVTVLCTLDVYFKDKYVSLWHHLRNSFFPLVLQGLALFNVTYTLMVKSFEYNLKVF